MRFLLLFALLLSSPAWAQQGVVSGASVTATGGSTSATLAARAGHMLNVIDDFGAVPDATGGVGGGTDNTTAIQAALSKAKTVIYIPNGDYRFTSSITIANGTSVQCQDPKSTTLWFDDASGTQDAFIVNAGTGVSRTVADVSIKGCQIIRTQAATAGALIHITNGFDVVLENNHIGFQSASRSYDNVRVDCSGTHNGTIEVYFKNNLISGALHDGVNLSCSGPMSIADVFFEGRNYIQVSANAGVELAGAVGWTHFDATDFDNNTGTAILADGTGGSGNNAVININGSHFEGNGADINLTNESWVTMFGNEFVSTGGIVCTLCTSVTGGHNLFESNTGIALNGVSGYGDYGSHFATTNGARTGMVVIGPSGTTPSVGVSITGGVFSFTNVPFMTFIGSANPATHVYLGANSVQGLCWSGTNVSFATFSYACGGNLGDSSAGTTNLGDIALNGVNIGPMGNLYYDANAGGWHYFMNGTGGAISLGAPSGNHAMAFKAAGLNGAGPGAAASTPGVAGYVETDGSLQWGVDTPCGAGCVNAGKYQANGSALNPITVTTITSTGTFTPKATSTVCDVEIWGNGGGGGAGVVGATSTALSGGGAGGGGSHRRAMFPCASLSSPVTVTVGAAGGGGATSGANGTAGGTTSFGTYLTAPGGGFGAGGGTANSGGGGGGGPGSAGGNASGATGGSSNSGGGNGGGGGNGSNSYLVGAAGGGGGDTAGAAGSSGNFSADSGCGGGAGGGISVGNAAFAGGSSFCGASGGAIATNAPAVAAYVNGSVPQIGGGGGGSAIGANGGNGAAGQAAAGGGGGGSAQTGFTAGTGGAGGAGLVLVREQ